MVRSVSKCAFARQFSPLTVNEAHFTNTHLPPNFDNKILQGLKVQKWAIVYIIFIRFLCVHTQVEAVAL